MALTFPLSTALFFDLLPISRVTFRLGAALTSSETGGGEVITHRIGARLWTGEITLDKDRHRELAAVEALIALLEEPGASFLLHDKRQVGPRGRGMVGPLQHDARLDPACVPLVYDRAHRGGGEDRAWKLHDLLVGDRVGVWEPLHETVLTNVRQKGLDVQT